MGFSCPYWNSWASFWGSPAPIKPFQVFSALFKETFSPLPSQKSRPGQSNHLPFLYTLVKIPAKMCTKLEILKSLLKVCKARNFHLSPVSQKVSLWSWPWSEKNKNFQSWYRYRWYSDNINYCDSHQPWSGLWARGCILRWSRGGFLSQDWCESSSLKICWIMLWSYFDHIMIINIISSIFYTIDEVEMKPETKKICRPSPVALRRAANLAVSPKRR